MGIAGYSLYEIWPMRGKNLAYLLQIAFDLWPMSITCFRNNCGCYGGCYGICSCVITCTVNRKRLKYATKHDFQIEYDWCLAYPRISSQWAFKLQAVWAQARMHVERAQIAWARAGVGFRWYRILNKPYAGAWCPDFAETLYASNLWYFSTFALHFKFALGF